MESLSVTAGIVCSDSRCGQLAAVLARAGFATIFRWLGSEDVLWQRWDTNIEDWVRVESHERVPTVDVVFHHTSDPSDVASKSVEIKKWVKFGTTGIHELPSANVCPVSVEFPIGHSPFTADDIAEIIHWVNSGSIPSIASRGRHAQSASLFALAILCQGYLICHTKDGMTPDPEDTDSREPDCIRAFQIFDCSPLFAERADNSLKIDLVSRGVSERPSFRTPAFWNIVFGDCRPSKTELARDLGDGNFRGIESLLDAIYSDKSQIQTDSGEREIRLPVVARAYLELAALVESRSAL